MGMLERGSCGAAVILEDNDYFESGVLPEG